MPASELSAEQSAEIEATPPVNLGKKNNFVEDEVDALAGVPSNVPPSTQVGCLFELLRSGGSQGFLRRLCNQFRTTLPLESPHAVASWSKTETLVVLVLTFYPRVLRRLKSWLGDSPFSLELQTSYSGVKCTVRCCPDDSLREVCVVVEDHGAASCEAEMQCIARLLSLFATDRALWSFKAVRRSCLTLTVTGAGPLVVLCRLLLLCLVRIVFDSLSMRLVLWASVQWTYSQP